MARITEVKTVLFVGAGGSAPFGYATTDQFINEVKNLALDEPERQILQSYTEAPNITIEDIIRALDIRIKEANNRLLRQEAVSPLRTMRSASSVIENADERTKLENEFSKEAERLDRLLNAYKTLKDRIVSQIYISYADKPNMEHAWEIYESYISILREQNGSVIPISTTNYDRVIESLADIPDADIQSVVTGFRRQEKGLPRNPLWAPEVFDEEPQKDKILLFKLHGSLNWRMDNRHLLREAEEGRFDLRGFWTENVLVPPGTDDFRYGEPYHSLRTYFEGYLERAQSCLVIGYRFDDLTIRDFFVRNLRRGLRLILVSPDAETVRDQKADISPEFRDIVCIPKKMEEAAQDVTEALRSKKPAVEVPETPPTEPEAEAPPTTTPEEV